MFDKKKLREIDNFVVFRNLTEVHILFGSSRFEMLRRSLPKMKQTNKNQKKHLIFNKIDPL